EIGSGKTDKINFLGSDLIFRGPLGKEFLLLEDTISHDLIVLDFHATHERINLEKITKTYKARKINSQTFLKPFRFFITPEQRNVLMESLSYLSTLGFDFRSPKGKKREIEVHAIPSILIKCDLNDFLTALVDTLPKSAIEEQTKEILSLIACHGSYRAGDLLSFQQTKNLLQDLLQTENPHICAHGRPLYFRISYHDLLKQVKRI
ncbi:MAG: hypothetical protein ACFFFH_21060, partial [Candidatus Thorarchaeota archaeon]